MNWHSVLIKGLWGFILGGFGGLLGGVVVALMTPPQDATLLWSAFSAWLAAALGSAFEEGAREVLMQKKVMAP